MVIVVVVVIVVVIVVENVIVVVVIALYHRSSSFFFFCSFCPFSASKVGMTTTAMSFAFLHGYVVHHGGGGIIEISNRHWIPPIYCLGRLLLKMLL